MQGARLEHARARVLFPHRRSCYGRGQRGAVCVCVSVRLCVIISQRGKRSLASAQ